jgi:hypothetical protein
MAVREQVLQANRSYSESFDKGELPIPPWPAVRRRHLQWTRASTPRSSLGLEGGRRARDQEMPAGVVSGRRAAFADHLPLVARDRRGARDRAHGLRDAHFTNDDSHAKLADETGADATGIDFCRFPISTTACGRASSGAQLRPSSGELHRDRLRYDCSTGALREGR